MPYEELRRLLAEASATWRRGVAALGVDPALLAGAAAALALLALALVLLAARKARRRRRALEAAQERAEAAEEEAAAQRERAESFAAEALALRVEAARLETRAAQASRLEAALSEERAARERLAAERAAQEARARQLEALNAKMEERFGAVAQGVMEKNGRAFLDAALHAVTERFAKHSEGAEAELEKRRAAIEALLRPVSDNLTRLETHVGALERRREGAYSEVRSQIQALAEGQSLLRGETAKLVQALRAPKARGRWGELQLKQLFEMVGMVEGNDYHLERHVPGEERALRPDAVVRLPGGRSIVIDVKTPLEGYLQAVEATEEAEREAALKRHVGHLREHVKQLSAKAYWEALADSPDFVVMFVPGEAFYSAAIERDHALFEHAYGKRVLIATPTTLVALLKCVAYGWQQEKAARNARVIHEAARELHARVAKFGEHMARLGRALGASTDAFNKAVGALEKRVLPAARRFEELEVPPAGAELAPPERVEDQPRALAAPDWEPSARTAAE